MNLRSLLPFAIFVIGCSGNAPIDPSAGASDRAAAATDLGRLGGDTQIDFVVGLALRRPTELHRLLSTRTVGDEPLQPDDFAEGFAPTAQEYWRVVQWLSAHGALVTRTAAGRTTVTAHATAAVVESLFATELHQYSDADGTFFAATGPIAVANDLIGTVNGVVGLSGTGYWKPHLAWPNLSAGAALAPADMEKIYGSAAIANPGMGETVAILGAGGAPDPTMDVGDFMSSYKPYGMTSAPNYSQFLLGGPTRESPASANGELVENVLDAEMVLSMAPLANVVHVIAATNSPGLFTDGISYIVNQVSQAHAVTVSYGGCERGASQETAVMNTLFQQAQAEGQQWFFASGDTGTDGCRDGAGNKHITAGWPTSSPYIIGVGGTMIGNGGVEITWNQNSAKNGEVGRWRRTVGDLLQARLSDGQDAERQRARYAGHLGHRRRRWRLHRLPQTARHRRWHLGCGADLRRRLGARRPGQGRQGHHRRTDEDLRGRHVGRVQRRDDGRQRRPRRLEPGLSRGRGLRPGDGLGQPERRDAHHQPPVRTPIVRKSLLMISAALAVAACSNDNKSGPTKRVSADGNTFAIATDGAQHVAYLIGPTSGYAAPGDLHLTGTDGKDTLVARASPSAAFCSRPTARACW